MDRYDLLCCELADRKSPFSDRYFTEIGCEHDHSDTHCDRCKNDDKQRKLDRERADDLCRDISREYESKKIDRFAEKLSLYEMQLDAFHKKFNLMCEMQFDLDNRIEHIERKMSAVANSVETMFNEGNVVEKCDPNMFKRIADIERYFAESASDSSTTPELSHLR